MLIRTTNSVYPNQTAPKKSSLMRGSRNFCQGGPGQTDKKKALTTFFLFFFSPQLFYRSQMVDFKEIFHFSRFQRGSNIFQGGGGGGSNFFQGGPIAYSL